MTHADVQPCWDAELDGHLAWLLRGGRELAGGAELEVRDNDRVVFCAPLARHHRVDHTGTLWVRPIVGGVAADGSRPGQPRYAFDPNVARRRALSAVRVRRAGVDLVVDLSNGQQARIRPARGARLATLRHWDTWLYTAVRADEEAELDALATDPT